MDGCDSAMVWTKAPTKIKVTKTEGANEAVDYELQLPLNNALITLKAPGLSQDDVIKLANTLPLQDIAKMLQ